MVAWEIAIVNPGLGWAAGPRPPACDSWRAEGGKRGYCGRVRAWRGGGLYEVPVRLPVERELGEIPFEFTLE